MIKSYTDIQSFMAEKSGLVPPAVISINEEGQTPITGYRFREQDKWSYYKDGRGYTEGRSDKLGDIVYVDSTGNKNICNYLEYSPSMGTPIGILVLPGKMMSLKWMSCDTPKSGSNDRQGMLWGKYNYVVPGLAQYTTLPVCDPEIEGGTTGTNSYGYLRTDFTEISIVEFPEDNETYHYYFNKNGYCTRYDLYLDGSLEEEGENSPFIPGPFKFDRVTSNPEFQYAGTAFETLDGKSQTDKIWEIITNKTGTISYNNQDHYPATNCCKRYFTPGTNKGDWYLPSIGELAYLMFNISTVNKSLASVGASIISMDNRDPYLWSSSQYSSNNAWRCGTGNGDCGNYDKRFLYGCVRAFCSL